MQRDSRKIVILDEPIGGQAKGEDGEYVKGEVRHVMRRGYSLHVLYCDRKKTQYGWSESFMLFSSGKQVMVINDPGAYSRKKLEQAAAAAGTVIDSLKAEVLVLREENLKKREQEKQEKAVFAS